MWPNPQFPADLVTFTEEILNRKLYFLCRDRYLIVCCFNFRDAIEAIVGFITILGCLVKVSC